MKSKNSKRLDSIKAAHQSERNQSSTRMEDYLEIISELVELKGYATTLDISRYMGVSAPSVTKMLQRLDTEGYLEYEKYHGINLTQKGTQVADSIRQKHGILLEFFDILGIGHETANQDAEGIEHYLCPKCNQGLCGVCQNPMLEHDIEVCDGCSVMMCPTCTMYKNNGDIICDDCSEIGFHKKPQLQ